MMNIRKEKLNVITSAGPGVQERDKVGYDMYFLNGNKHPKAFDMKDTIIRKLEEFWAEEMPVL